MSDAIKVGHRLSIKLEDIQNQLYPLYQWNKSLKWTLLMSMKDCIEEELLQDGLTKIETLKIHLILYIERKPLLFWIRL